MPEMKTLNGYEIVDAVARESKVDKRTYSFSNNSRAIVYGVNNLGEQTVFGAIRGGVATSGFPMFDGGGRLWSNDPEKAGQ